MVFSSKSLNRIGTRLPMNLAQTGGVVDRHRGAAGQFGSAGHYAMPENICLWAREISLIGPTVSMASRLPHTWFLGKSTTSISPADRRRHERDVARLCHLQRSQGGLY
jgi:hypothetical protein